MTRLLMGVAAAALLAGQALAQTATLGQQLEPPTLDPTAGAAGAIDQVMHINVFEGLTRFAEDGSIIPGLATSWEISDDGLVYTFTLAEGVKFHDGADLTAEDVVFSFERAVAEGSTNAQQGLFEPIESVEAVDPTTVRLTLKRPTGNMLFNLAWGDMVIVDPASADTNGTAPVGTGAFRFVEWRQGDSITLERNPDYWGEPAGLEGVTVKFISDPTAALAALLSGDLDAYPGYPSPETAPQFEADPRFTVVNVLSEGETILSTNNRREPFDDVRVRRAMAHAIDKQAIIDGAMFGMGEPIGTHFNPASADYVQELTDLYPYDPEGAKALLAEAGYPDGFEATLKLPPPSYARRGGEIVAAQLREVGIDLSIENVEWAQWLEQVFSGKDYDLTIVSHTEPMDIGIYANPDYYFQYDSAEFQETMATLAGESDPAARSELLAKAQRIIAEDAVNGYLFQLALPSIWPARMEGYWSSSPTQALDMTGLRWTE